MLKIPTPYLCAFLLGMVRNDVSLVRRHESDSLPTTQPKSANILNSRSISKDYGRSLIMIDMEMQ